MSIENVTPQITLESTPDEVQDWLLTYDGGYFKEYSDVFKRRDGKKMLSYDKEDFINAGVLPLDAADLYNALHPDDDVEMGDVQDTERLKVKTSNTLITEENSWYFSEREETMAQLYDIFQNQPVLLVSAPPGSGKTILAKLFSRFLFRSTENSSSVYYLQCKNDLAYHPLNILNQLEEGDFLIVDEAQVTYDMRVGNNKTFWESIKGVIDLFEEENIIRKRILLFSGYGSSKRIIVKGVTPLDSNCMYFDEILRYKPSEIREVMNSFFQEHQDLDTVDVYYNILSRVEGHPGYLSRFLKYLHRAKINYPNIFKSYYDVMYNSELYRKLLDYRATPDLNALKLEFLDPVELETTIMYCKMILEELVLKGTLIISTTSELVEPAKILTVHGMISEEFDSINQGIILKFTCYMQRHLTYMKLSGSIQRAEGYEYLNNGIFSFFLTCVKKFSKENLANGTMNEDGGISEDMFQKEFYRVATELTPLDLHIYPENGKLKALYVPYIETEGIQLSIKIGKDQTVEGKPDFYINSNLQWLLEFLVGNSIERFHEHLDRFLPPHGQYYSPNIQQFLVVWFLKREHIPKEGIPRTHPLINNSLIIIYGDEGFEWQHGSGDQGTESFSF